MNKYLVKHKYLIDYVKISILFLLSFAILAPEKAHGSDINDWLRWTKFLFENNLSSIYNIDVNYPPIYLYILKVFGSIQGSIENITQNIYTLKLITFCFTLISAFFLQKLLVANSKKEDFNNSWIYYILNIAVLYNTLIWGQVDEIQTCFVFLSFYFAVQKKNIFSLVFIVIAINFKLQAIIFVPLIGLLLIQNLRTGKWIPEILKWILIILFLQCVILFPFMISGNTQKVWDVFHGSIDKFPFISMCAYNIWNFLLDDALLFSRDSNIIWGLTYKNWGMIAFFVLSFVAMFPLIINIYRKLFSRPVKELSLEQLIIFSLIPLLFFFLNTQMHERYSHPSIIFLVSYSIYSKNYLISIIGSMAYFLNLEAVLHYFHFPNYGILFLIKISSLVCFY